MEAASQDGGGERRVCNVCHLPYEGEECPWCKAEREGASEVIQERGRRHTEADGMGKEDSSPKPPPPR
jgi:DNA-binding helix-hairpin-helix protein with protein kinase domain